MIIVGILLFFGGIAFGIYQYRHNAKTGMEIQYMQTSSIKDAADIVDNMSSADPNYRHYVELKGMAQRDEPMSAPFSGREVVYYENRCLSVYEETRVVTDKEGHRRTERYQREDEISHEKSPADFFIKDNSSDLKVYIDMDSFGGKAQLMSACDRFESENSSWIHGNQNRFAFLNNGYFNGSHGSSRLLGYRFKESILPIKQPLYLLGELYRMGDRYYIGSAIVSKKPSALSYKSEDQLVKEAKDGKIMSIVLGAGIALLGLFIVFAKL